MSDVFMASTTICHILAITKLNQTSRNCKTKIYGFQKNTFYMFCYTMEKNWFQTKLILLKFKLAEENEGMKDH